MNVAGYGYFVVTEMDFSGVDGWFDLFKR